MTTQPRPAPSNQDHDTVAIGTKPFLLFPSEATQKRYSDVGKTYIYNRLIMLDAHGALPLLPLRLYAGATHMSRKAAVSPYTDDASGQDGDEIDYAGAPLCFDASICAEVLRGLHLMHCAPYQPDPLLPDAKAAISRLRLHLWLPKKATLHSARQTYDKFIASPDETALSLGELRFWQFTPCNARRSKPLFVMLPSDDAIVQNLQGYFTLGSGRRKVGSKTARLACATHPKGELMKDTTCLASVISSPVT